MIMSKINAFSPRICWFLLLCTLFLGLDVFGQNEQTGDARLLAGSTPFLYPYIEVSVTDLKQRTSAEKVIAAQMRALEKLKGCQDVSVVPILIPYLNYTTGVLPPSRFSLHGALSKESTVPDTELLSKNWPAFGIILHMHNSDKVLVQYLQDKKNPPNCRLAALVVLRYLNQEEFGKCVNDMSNEYRDADSSVRTYLEAVKSGKVSFDGIVPVIRVNNGSNEHE